MKTWHEWLNEYRDRLTGHEIDDDYGVPDENLRCPGCGRRYTACKIACTSCYECKKCHSSCDAPNFVAINSPEGIAFLQDIADNA